MKYHYEPGATRWFRHDGKGDVRAHRCRKGWEASADILNTHPVTGKALKSGEWWIRETFTGEE